MSNLDHSDFLKVWLGSGRVGIDSKDLSQKDSIPNNLPTKTDLKKVLASWNVTFMWKQKKVKMEQKIKRTKSFLDFCIFLVKQNQVQISWPNPTRFRVETVPISSSRHRASYFCWPHSERYTFVHPTYPSFSPLIKRAVDYKRLQEAILA